MSRSASRYDALPEARKGTLILTAGYLAAVVFAAVGITAVFVLLRRPSRTAVREPGYQATASTS